MLITNCLSHMLEASLQVHYKQKDPLAVYGTDNAGGRANGVEGYFSHYT